MAVPNGLTPSTTRSDGAGASSLRARLRRIYGDTVGFERWCEGLEHSLDQLAAARPQALRALDARRLAEGLPGPGVIGYCAYVDRFAGSLRGVIERIPYLQRIGVGYLHLLPFTMAREGDNDGGFAVRDYERVDPRLGSDADLLELTAALRAADIRLCADLVLNHTADDHPWAQAARAGEARFRAFYRQAASADEVRAWEASLPQIFPRTAPGNFTRVDALDAWVWTTFYPYQWDLDWSNPEVFSEMLLAMARLANRGIEAFRLDSTAFLWKRPGTRCMNEPETHWIVQALRAGLDRVAPAVLLKAEAIVPTAELPAYFGLADPADPQRECQLAYSSSLMAAGWGALASRSADLPARVLDALPALPAGSAWINYVRCHDDIGWQVLAEEAAASGVDLAAIASHFAGADGSDARGESFQSESGESAHGTNGMSAALCGLTAARAGADPARAKRALDRMLLLHGLALSLPGLPVLYMGDEIALDNDEAWRSDPLRAHEGRWLHRPPMPWLADGELPVDDAGRRFGEALADLIALRGRLQALSPEVGSKRLLGQPDGLLAFMRGAAFVAAFNFGERVVSPLLPPGRWRALCIGLAESTLAPLQFQWFQRETDA